jgi:hypothetical protein
MWGVGHLPSAHDLLAKRQRELAEEGVQQAFVFSEPLIGYIHVTTLPAPVLAERADIRKIWADDICRRND